MMETTKGGRMKRTLFAALALIVALGFTLVANTSDTADYPATEQAAIERAETDFGMTAPVLLYMTDGELSLEGGDVIVGAAESSTGLAEKDLVCSSLCTAWTPIKCSYEVGSYCNFTVAHCDCGVWNAFRN